MREKGAALWCAKGGFAAGFSGLGGNSRNGGLPAASENVLKLLLQTVSCDNSAYRIDERCSHRERIMKRWECGAYAVIKIIFKAMDYLKNSLRLQLSFFPYFSAGNPDNPAQCRIMAGGRFYAVCCLPVS